MANWIPIKDAFSKWFIDGYARDKIPANFAGYLRNVRINNKSITPRKGSQFLGQYGNSSDIFHCLKWTAGEMLGIVGNQFRVVNPFNRFIATLPSSNEYTIISLGQESLILDGQHIPYRYKSGNSRIDQLKEDELPQDKDRNPILGFCPIIWTVFANYAFVAGNIDGYDKDRVYLSRPTEHLPQGWEASIHDFSGAYDSENRFVNFSIKMPSNVVGMIGTNQNLYIFCEKSIEVLTLENFINQINNNFLFSTLSIGDNDYLLHRNAVCAAENNIFFMTKNLHVKSIGYTAGIVNPTIADLSDTPWLDISKWIEDNIGKDQRRPFAFYNNAEQTIEFHLGTKIEIEGSNPTDYTTNGVNNIVLIYDLHNQSFLVDDNKSFNCADFAYIPWEDAEVYAGSAINNRLYHMVERYYDTDGTSSLITTTPIKCEYDTPNICLGNPSDLKFFRWVNFSGMMNKFTRFDITVFIDGKQAFHKIITWEDIAESERKALNVGWPDKDQMKEVNLMPFDYVADQGKIRKKWKRIRLQIIANTVWNNFCLNNLAFNAEAIGKFELSDRF